MVAVMEVKADRKGRYWEDIEGCGPTAAEIETLRKGIRLNATPDERRAACDLVDRLSPPAPEVDEATVWTRKVMDANWSYWGSNAEMRSEIIRQAIAELIASKDAEIAEWKAALRHAHDLIGEADNRTWKAESELAAISAAIGTTEFMDPPDGGSPTLAEQVGRMRAELAALRAENERLVKERDYLLECNGRSFVRAERLEDMMEAAERNTAEPKKRYSFEECSIENGWVDFTKPATSATDTTPEVVVTQADREFVAAIHAHHFPRSTSTQRSGLRIEVAQYRTEAEARGRREAFREVKRVMFKYEAAIANASNCQRLVDELRGLIMTEPKP